MKLVVPETVEAEVRKETGRWGWLTTGADQGGTGVIPFRLWASLAGVMVALALLTRSHVKA